MVKDLNQGVNVGKFILAAVVSSVPCEGGSPLYVLHVTYFIIPILN